MGELHFGRAHAPLFGVYQAPLTDVDRDSGIVVCNAFGPEYTRSHRALRQLGIKLAQAGHHVLRFDYHGSGDSAGSALDNDLSHWQADVSLAIDALKEEAGVSRVSLVGLRLGAAIACSAASTRRDVDDLVLWEPVVSGPSYLQEIRSLHAAFVDQRPWLPRASNREEDAVWEFIGFPLAATMRAGIRGIALDTLKRRPARRVLLVADSTLASVQGLSAVLRGLGSEVEEAPSPKVAVWRPDEDGHGIVPTATLSAIVGWLGESR